MTDNGTPSSPGSDVLGHLPAVRSRAPSKSRRVKNRPMPLGTVARIIMAPEMLAGASLALPRRTQITAFMISGSSVVAIGDSSSAVTLATGPASGR